MGRFIGEIKLSPIVSGTGRTFKVSEPFSYRADNGDRVNVPSGFVTDLATIPRLIWVLYPPEGLWTDPAIVHDEAYSVQEYSRARCDEILLEAMKDCGVSWITRHIIYRQVRLWGWISWKKRAS